MHIQFGRDRRIVLGRVDTLDPDEARQRCQKVLGNVAHGYHPLHGIPGSEGMTLGKFIADAYTTWINASRRRSPSTVLRDLFALSSVLRRAVKEGELAENSVRRVDRPRIDRRGKVRFLDEAEEERLRVALRERDEFMRSARTAASIRHQKRGEPLLPALVHFGNHLTPAVLLSMNTGLRRGELLKLQWSSVDLERRVLTVEGHNAKSRQTRHVPLNDEATSVLRNWQEQTGDEPRVFAVATNYKNGWKALLKRAGITQFRWHDMCHHFASRLVRRGVPLNTVRDLPGHRTAQMSLRYAHLAPDQRREAVAKLNERPILALTLRLPWNGVQPGSGYLFEENGGKGRNQYRCGIDLMSNSFSKPGEFPYQQKYQHASEPV